MMPNHTNDEYDALRRRNNSYAAANMEQGKKLDDLRIEFRNVELICKRVESELTAERSTMQTVLDDNNRRYRSMNDEVLRLRTLLKESGISPD